MNKLTFVTEIKNGASVLTPEALQNTPFKEGEKVEVVISGSELYADLTISTRAKHRATRVETVYDSNILRALLLEIGGIQSQDDPNIWKVPVKRDVLTDKTGVAQKFVIYEFDDLLGDPITLQRFIRKYFKDK